MSIDENIDSFLRMLSPTAMALWLIFLYNRATNLAAPYVAQTQRTFEAIHKSFHPEAVLCFYDGVTIPVVLGHTIESNMDYAEKPRWFYSEGKFFEQKEQAQETGKSYPWLAADIMCDGKKVADITDFVIGLRYLGDKPPTPEYILGLWSYKNNCLLRRSHTQLVVIDGEATTHSFNFATTAADDASWLQSLGASAT